MRPLHRPGFIARMTETWFRRPRAPTRVVLDVTRRCNLRCEMCRTWRIEPGHELLPEELRALLVELPGLLWLDVTGGEIFLRRDAEAILDVICEASPSLAVLHFPTNGWFVERTCAAVRRLRARRPDLELIVTVSIDGPRELHDRIRGREGSFDRAIETFRRLRVIEGAAVYVGTTVTPSNAAHADATLAALVAEVPDLRAAEWHWNWLQVSKHFFDNEDLAADGARTVPPGALLREHIARRGLPRNLVELMELVFLVNLDFYRRGEPSGITCQSLRSACFISPEGDLYPCHVWDRPLGNVRARSIVELWNSDEARAARVEVERLACGGCFTPCEAYPAIAGAPLSAIRQTGRRALTLLARGRGG